MASAPLPDGSRRSDSVPLPEVWAGVECSHVRVGRRVVDQLELTGHRRRAADIDLIASLGVSAVRYPVLWEHVCRRGLPSADWTWADDRLSLLHEGGLQPVVGLLHHGSGPSGMSLEHPGFVTAFARYARAVAERYPWLSAFIPINEPFTTARFGGLYGWWQPHRRSEDAYARLLLTECVAYRAAARAIRAANPSATLIVNEDVGRTFATPALAGVADLYNQRRWLTWDLLFGRVGRSHALYDELGGTRENRRLLDDLAADPQPPDLLGVDNYITSDRFLDDRVNLYPKEFRGSDSVGFVDVEATRVPGVPGHSVERAIADTWRRYGVPLAVTEISLAGGTHDQVAWWQEAWNAALQARARGVDVRAVTAWGVFGAVDWHCLMRCRDNRYEPGAFDVRDDPPRPRPLAAAIRASAGAARGPGTRAPAATLQATGWWTRPDRFMPTLEP
jgi:dTDP-4-dehydrorhamnose reductase